MMKSVRGCYGASLLDIYIYRCTYYHRSAVKLRRNKKMNILSKIKVNANESDLVLFQVSKSAFFQISIGRPKIGTLLMSLQLIMSCHSVSYFFRNRDRTKQSLAHS